MKQLSDRYETSNLSSRCRLLQCMIEDEHLCAICPLVVVCAVMSALYHTQQYEHRAISYYQLLSVATSYDQLRSATQLYVHRTIAMRFLRLRITPCRRPVCLTLSGVHLPSRGCWFQTSCSYLPQPITQSHLHTPRAGERQTSRRQRSHA